MKQALLPVGIALLLCIGSTTAFACDEHEKSTTAEAKSAVACPTTKGSAVTADYKAADHASGCRAHGAAAAKYGGASAGACKAFGASLVTASGCGGKNATAVLRTASAGGNCCASKGGARGTAASAAVYAMPTGGSSCHSGQSADAHDCDACAQISSCDAELVRLGIETQVVSLKNGVMIVYTATSHGRVQAVQSAMARRQNRVQAIIASGDKVKLCAECRSMRGAMASGKLTRETVNIGNGVLTVMTSNDPKMVARLQGMATSSKT